MLLTSLPVLGSFGKGVDGAASLNYAPSAGHNCDPRCPLLNRGCYARRTEIRPDRSELAAKLRRHLERGAADVTAQALGELEKRADVPWFRVSTNGSVPQNPGREFAKALRALLGKARDRSIPVHFPVESPDKARTYRRITRGLAVIRESTHTLKRWLSTRGACSIVAGSADMTRLERVAESKRVAALRTQATGRKCIVCPAVAARYLNGNKPSDKAKCGNCTACAMPDVDVVYPLH